MKILHLQCLLFGLFLILSPSYSMVTNDDDDGDPSPTAPVASSSSSSTSSTPQKGSRLRRARALTVQLSHECVGLLQEKIAEWAKKPIRRRELPPITKELPSPRAQPSPRGRVIAPDDYYKYRSSPNLKSSAERTSLRDSPQLTPRSIPLKPTPTEKELQEFRLEYKKLLTALEKARQNYTDFKDTLLDKRTTSPSENAKGDVSCDEDITTASTPILRDYHYFPLVQALNEITKASSEKKKYLKSLKKKYAIRINRKGEIVIDNGFLTPRSTKSPSEPTLERASESLD